MATIARTARLTKKGKNGSRQHERGTQRSCWWPTRPSRAMRATARPMVAAMTSSPELRGVSPLRLEHPRNKPTHRLSASPATAEQSRRGRPAAFFELLFRYCRE